MLCHSLHVHHLYFSMLLHHIILYHVHLTMTFGILICLLDTGLVEVSIRV